MDALSSEWRRGVQYLPGDRVAFKLGDSVGVAAFECMQAREYSTTFVPMGIMLTYRDL